MPKIFRLSAFLILLPSLAAAYGGDYGVHCTSAMRKAGKCKSGGAKAFVPPVQANATTAGSGAASAPGGAPAGAAGAGAAQAPGTPPPGSDTLGNFNKAASGLSESTAGADGKCPAGSTAVPGLGGKVRCVPNGGK